MNGRMPAYLISKVDFNKTRIIPKWHIIKNGGYKLAETGISDGSGRRVTVQVRVANIQTNHVARVDGCVQSWNFFVIRWISMIFFFELSWKYSLEWFSGLRNALRSSQPSNLAPFWLRIPQNWSNLEHFAIFSENNLQNWQITVSKNPEKSVGTTRKVF